MDFVDKILQGDALAVLKTLPSESVDCCVTSPPYWGLRDYGVEGQLGLEPNFRDYITKLADIFDEVKRVLKPEGTLWVNLGDTYVSATSERSETGSRGITAAVAPGTASASPTTGRGARNRALMDAGLSMKSLVQIPSRFAIEMTDRGWILRNELIWHKPNCMPSSVKDRFTVDFEKLFFFTKSKRYYFETQYEDAKSLGDPRLNAGRIEYADAKFSRKSRPRQYGSNAFVTVNEQRNKRAVWTIPTKPFSDAHFAVFPEELVETPIKAGCPPFGIVLDPFMGAGTTALVAKKLVRHFAGIELNPEYIGIAKRRITQQVLQVA